MTGSTASFNGGGIYSAASFTLTGSTVSGDSALNGGGISASGGLPTLTDDTISGDSACKSTNVDLRMDTKSAQDFLAQFGVPRG